MKSIERKLKLQEKYKSMKKRKVKRRGKWYIFRAWATYKLNLAIKKGEIQRPENCSNCGYNFSIIGHHCDYSKPYIVIWLCRSCHDAWHFKPEKWLYLKSPYIMSSNLD